MARRTMTIKRLDPWSVLKVGFLANLVLLGILLLAGRVVWFFVDRLELVTKACDVAESVGFTDCGLNGGNIFRNALLLGLLGVVVQTGILVFGAFLFNLIAELTGGLTVGVEDDLAGRQNVTAAKKGTPTRAVGRTKVASGQGGGGGVAQKVATAAKTAAGAAAGAASGAASSASDAARQAAAKAQAARAAAEARAQENRQTGPQAPTQQQPRPAQPQQPPQGQPSRPQPTEDLFGARREGGAGPQGPFGG